MSKRQSELEHLIEYLIRRCVEAGQDENRDRFINCLIDYGDVVTDYIKQVSEMPPSKYSPNQSQIARIFLSSYLDLYRELSDLPLTYRTDVVGEIVSKTRDSRDFHLPNLYGEFLSALNKLYQIETKLGEPDFDWKRSFVTRYNILINASVSLVKRSDSTKKFGLSEKIWDSTITGAGSLLKTAIETGDIQTYSEIVNELCNFRKYEILHNIGDSEEEVSEELADFAEQMEVHVGVLTFVLTAWAFRRFKSGDLTKQDYVEIEQTSENKRNSISSVAEIYYGAIRDEDWGRFGFWEQWNLDEAMEETMGVAVTAPAATSWLFEFYCAELLRLGFQDYLVDDSLEYSKNPIPVNNNIINQPEKVRSTLESLVEGNVSGHFLPDNIDSEKIIDYLAQIHEEAEQQNRENMRKRVHQAPLDPQRVSSFLQSIQTKFVEVCTLRQALQNLEILGSGQSAESEKYELGTLQVPRRALVTVGDIPLHLSEQRYVNPIQDKYRELLLDHLKLKSETVSSKQELLDRIRQYTDSRDVAAILTTLGYTENIFRGDEEYKYVLTPEEQVFETQYGLFAGIPVLDIRGDQSSVVLLFESETQIIEQSSSEQPLNLAIVSAEESFSDEDLHELSDSELENVWSWTHMKVAYECQFVGRTTLGVELHVE